MINFNHPILILLIQQKPSLTTHSPPMYYNKLNLQYSNNKKQNKKKFKNKSFHYRYALILINLAIIKTIFNS